MKKPYYNLPPDKIIVLVDIDDVMIDLLPAWVDRLNRMHSLSVSVDDITEWNMAKAFPTLNNDEIYEPFNSKLFWRTVKPKIGAVESLKLLSDEGYTIMPCSTTYYKCVEPKFEYVVKKYFPFISWNDVIITAHKDMISGHFLIDDGVHNLTSEKQFKILFSAPHNQNCEINNDSMVRANSWADVVNIIHNNTLRSGSDRKYII